MKAARKTLVATELGMKVATDLDEIIYQKVGPGKIRPSIEALVESGRPDPMRAGDILDQINDFTDMLGKVHEKIRKKAIQPAKSTVRRRQSPKSSD